MRPELNIRKEPVDYLLDIIGIAALVTLVVLPIIYWSELPEMVPHHFNGQGQPDAWSGKESLWVMPIVAIVLFAGVYYITTKPHLFNYPSEINSENAAKKYRTMARFMRILNAVVALSFAYISYAALQTAIGTRSGLGNWFLPLFIILTLGIPVGLLLLNSRSKK